MACIALFHCVAGVTECHPTGALGQHPGNTLWLATGSDGNRAEQFHPRIGVLTGQTPLIPSSQGILRRQGSLSSASPLKKPAGTWVRAFWEFPTCLHRGYCTYWGERMPRRTRLVWGKHTMLIHDHTNSRFLAGCGDRCSLPEMEQSLRGQPGPSEFGIRIRWPSLRKNLIHPILKAVNVICKHQTDSF